MASGLVGWFDNLTDAGHDCHVAFISLKTACLRCYMQLSQTGAESRRCLSQNGLTTPGLGMRGLLFLIIPVPLSVDSRMGDSG